MLDSIIKSIETLDLSETKYIVNKLSGILISSEMQNGRINTVEEQLLDVCLSNMLNESNYIEVISSKHGNFTMQMEEYILYNKLPNGYIYLSFADYEGMNGFDDFDIDEDKFFRSIDIPLREVESVKVCTLFLINIKTVDDEIEIRMV